MEVRPGYKLTEAGVIPETWQVFPLAALAHIKTGKRNNEDKIEDGEYPFFVRSDVVERINSYSYEGEAILVPGEGRIGDIFHYTNGRFDVHQRVYAITRFQADCNAQFLHRYMALRFGAWAMQNTVKATVDSLRLPTFQRFLVLLPPLGEQRAIAAALGDVDALLRGLDRLIAKKRDLKHAAMQQLLAGQTRLPGFSGEWEVKTLGSVFEISVGKSKSAYITDGGDFVICDMGSVSTDGRLITSKRTNYRGDFLLKGDLVMPKDDIGGGKIIGRVGYVDCPDKYVLGDHVYRLHALEGDPLFFSYLINSHSINSALRKKVIGSAQLGLGRRSVEEHDIPFPPPTEQRAISTILSDMDAELAALEARRDKTRDLKQAMMQELLTGKTRLVPTGAAHA